jgi:D-alanyl-D-alanine endopeptidase (penicillin-binding protein 7)
VSTPEDLAKLVIAAERHPLIRRWKIRLQKTGYISEAGRCMVLHATVKGRPTVMVFLDSQGKYSRAVDASSVRTWLASYMPVAGR